MEVLLDAWDIVADPSCAMYMKTHTDATEEAILFSIESQIKNSPNQMNTDPMKTARRGPKLSIIRPAIKPENVPKLPNDATNAISLALNSKSPSKDGLNSPKAVVSPQTPAISKEEEKIYHLEASGASTDESSMPVQRMLDPWVRLY